MSQSVSAPRFNDERLTSRQKLHKLTPLMADILALLNEHGPLSGDELGDRLYRSRRSGRYTVSSQGIGSSLSGLSARNLVEVERYGVGASCVWRTAR